MSKEFLLKSKLVRETLTANIYDLQEVEKEKAVVEQDLMRLLQKLAGNKSAVTIERNNEKSKGGSAWRQSAGRQRTNESREEARTLVERITEKEKYCSGSQKTNQTACA